MRIRICGTNHREAPVEVRERLSLPDADFQPTLRRLHELPGVREVVLVSTCNRVEVFWVDEGSGDDAMSSEMARWSGLTLGELEPHLITGCDDEAVRHLFRVCGSLDSMVLGESQILGQVKDAYRAACDSDTVGPLLHRLFHKAFAAAKRIRSETDVGASTLSVARASVDMAGAVFEDLSSKSVLLLGAGEMAELALRGFRDRGCRDLWVSNRTLSRAAEVAGPLEAAVLPWGRRTEFLAHGDIVVASTGAREPVITRKDVKAVRRKRRGRPLLLVDISVPRNLDPGIDRLDNVYLFDIDDLAQVVQAGQESRRTEAAKAERIVAEEVTAFSRVMSQVQVSPLLRALSQKVGRDGRQEVERTLSRLAPLLSGMSENERRQVGEALDRMVAAMGKRFLHDPLRRIKRLGEAGEVERIEEAAELLGVQATLMDVGDAAERSGEFPDDRKAGGSG